MPEPRDTVRLLTGATTDDASNDDIDGLLLQEGAVVKLAAADLLELMAGRLMTVDSDQIKVDGSKQAQTLMARAAALRAQHYERDGGDFYFGTTPLGPSAPYRLGPGWTDYQWGWEGPVI